MHSGRVAHILQQLLCTERFVVRNLANESNRLLLKKLLLKMWYYVSMRALCSCLSWLHRWQWRNALACRWWCRCSGQRRFGQHVHSHLRHWLRVYRVASPQISPGHTSINPAWNVYWTMQAFTLWCALKVHLKRLFMSNSPVHHTSQMWR